MFSMRQFNVAVAAVALSLPGCGKKDHVTNLDRRHSPRILNSLYFKKEWVRDAGAVEADCEVYCNKKNGVSVTISKTVTGKTTTFRLDIIDGDQDLPTVKISQTVGRSSSADFSRLSNFFDRAKAAAEENRCLYMPPRP